MVWDKDFFLSRKNSFRWDLKLNIFSVDVSDGNCDRESVEKGEIQSVMSSQQNVIINLGYSWF